MNEINRNYFQHSTAVVDSPSEIGDGVKIWHYAHLRENVRIGSKTIIAKGVYVDHAVSIGSNCKIQNNASIYSGVTIEDGVFIGPHVCFTNDMNPRACREDGEAIVWKISPTVVHSYASIGANSTIVCGIELGSYCLIGAGSVVTKSIPPYALAYGNPCRIIGVVSKRGYKVSDTYTQGSYTCPNTGEVFQV